MTGDLFGFTPPTGEGDKARVYRLAVEIAEESRREASAVRMQVAGLLKGHKPAAVADALEWSKGKRDPLTYARAILRGAVDDGERAFLSD